MKKNDRIVSLYFVDGTSLTFEFPEQADNAAAKQLKVADFLASKHIVIDSDTGLLVFPVANIKYISMRGPDGAFWKGAALPRGTIKGARLRT